MIAQDPKSADIIRPILRGKDIRRYSYVFADKYLITTYNEYVDSNGITHPSINANDYPAIKKHLDTYWEAINKRQDKGDTPYNLRRCAYMDDFNKPKVVYPNMTKYLPFYLDNDCFMVNQKCFIMTGEKLAFLTSFLNSKVFKSCFKDYFPELQGGTRELSKIFFERIPIPKNVQDKFISDEEIYKLYNFTEDEINWISSSVRE